MATVQPSWNLHQTHLQHVWCIWWQLKKKKTAAPPLLWNLPDSDWSGWRPEEWHAPLLTSVISSMLLWELAATRVLAQHPTSCCRGLFTAGSHYGPNPPEQSPSPQSWHGDSADKELKHVKRSSSAEDKLWWRDRVGAAETSVPVLPVLVQLE